MKRWSRMTTRGGSLLTFLGLILAIHWMHPGQLIAQTAAIFSGIALIAFLLSRPVHQAEPRGQECGVGTHEDL